VYNVRMTWHMENTLADVHRPSTADSFTFSMTDPIVGIETDQRGNIVASCSIESLVFLKPL
jgi:hypothetical protein